MRLIGCRQKEKKNQVEMEMHLKQSENDAVCNGWNENL
jgi:hypothetical protein